ncbi:MAG TPA: hypothetical protein DDY78_20190 [Planctomycetales bacterium]|jgi:hypothetical protein|nr:hypothetical protein [Planctomycetales bacterium]
MAEISLDNPYFKELADEHRTWLASFDARHRDDWERLLNGNVEAACCEVAVRRLLESFGVAVEPNEQLRADGGGPDFRCERNGTHFYTEVTCVLCATATSRTGISEEPSGFAPFAPFGMTEAIFSECVGKAKQCRDMDAPTIVAVGTFHSFAAMTCFKKVIVSSVLTGKTQMAWNIDISTGQQAGETYQLTELKKAAFLKPDPQQEVGFARSSISGLLLCGLGVSRCLGVLHPNPARSFDPTILQSVEFGRVELDRASRQLQVRWPNGGDE